MGGARLAGRCPACVLAVSGGVLVGDAAVKPEMPDDAGVHGDFGAVALQAALGLAGMAYKGGQ